MLTAPYADPVKIFVGRYLDSSSTREVQFPFRTARARLMGVDPVRNRLWMIVGSAMFGYDLQKFITRLESGEPMVSEAFLGNNQRGEFPETFLMYDYFFYAEKDSSWKWSVVDGQDRLFGFDFDDRGYVYLAYGPYGWGIVKDTGTGLSFAFQQVSDSSAGDVTPSRILSVKSGGNYYAIISSDNATNVFNVGTASTLAHDRMSNIPFVIKTFAKGLNDRIGTVSADGRLRVHTADGIVRGQALAAFEPVIGPYTSIDTDGTNFYATSHPSAGHEILTVLTPSGNSYSSTNIDLGRPYSSSAVVRYGNGYLVVFGPEAFDPSTDSASGSNIRLYKVSGTSLTPVPMQVGAAMPAVQNVTREFFASYYSRAGSGVPGYTFPNFTGIDGSGNPPGDVRLVKMGSKLYLIVAAVGLGDVYELRSGDSISAKVKKVGRSVNGKAAALAASGPFYGDEITFSSTSSAVVPPAVNWSFTGDTSLYTHPPQDPDIAYQYGGLTNSSFANGPVTRSASAIVDSNVSDTIQVQIKAPQIRVGINGHSELLFTQPDLSSSAPIVSSDQWIDASDGALESHFDTWRLDGTDTNAVADQAFGVGGCGTHTLVFTAHYGPNNAQNVPPAFTMKSTEATYAIDSIKYNVAPFTVAVKEPVKDPANAANILFGADLRTSTTPADLPSGASTPATFTWTLLNANGSSAGVQQVSSGTLGAPTTFSVAKANFSTPNMQVRLKVDIATAATGCTAFASQTATKTSLNGPTGSIAKNPSDGCLNLGSPCSFTFGAPNADWTYTWTATGNGVTVPGRTGTGAAYATYTPDFPSPGTYTIGVTVENAIGTTTPATVNVTLAQPVCGSPATQNNTTFGWSGATSGCMVPFDTCTPGETLTFFMQKTVPWISQDCDTFDWDFGDQSAHSQEKNPTHQYNVAGQYQVTFTLKQGNPTNPLVETQTLKVGTTGGGGGGNGGGGNGGGGNGGGGNGGGGNGGGGGGGTNPACGPLTNANVFVDYIGGSSGCTSSSGTCQPGESLQFVAGGTAGYNLSCTNHAYSWSFGDNFSGSNSSTSAQPVHAFSNAGTYTVTLTISNGYQNATTTASVRIGTSNSGGGGGGGGCPALTTANVSPSYSGATNNCHVGGTCTTNEQISFRVDTPGYPGNCSITSYAWTTTGNNAATAVATFTFPAPGDYNVFVTVSNPTTPSPVTVSVPVHVVNASGGSCPEMSTRNVYFGWFGPQTQCTSTYGDCRDSETISFQAYATAGYSFGCAVHSFTWDFDDGSPAETVQANTTIQHKFRGAGTFDVTLTITNVAGGQITLPGAKVRVANSSGVVPQPVSRHRPSRH